MKMVIAGGGTGGHLFPGIALADAFRDLDPASQVLFIGAERGLESRVLPGLGYELRTLPVRGVLGTGFFRGLARMAGLLAATLRAYRILGSVSPDLVVGVGGYASVPAVLAAWLRRVPRSILEQNVIPGRANRFLASVAERIYLGFPQAGSSFPVGKTVVTGNPIRESALSQPDRAPVDDAGGRALLVLGGSQGAAQLNDLALAVVPRLKRTMTELRVIHQTGSAGEEAVRERYREEGIDVEVVPFIEEMGRRYAEADLCLSRAGALAVSELAAAGLPSILIPYPYAAGDHQRANARWLEEQGGAVCVDPDAASPEQVGAELARLLTSSADLNTMAEAAGQAGNRDAARRIAGMELKRIRGAQVEG